MKYKSFNQMEVWQVSIDLATKIYRITDNAEFVSPQIKIASGFSFSSTLSILDIIWVIYDKIININLFILYFFLHWLSLFIAYSTHPFIEYFKKNNFEPTELLLSYTEHIKKYNELTETVNKNDVEAFLFVYNSKKV